MQYSKEQLDIIKQKYADMNTAINIQNKRAKAIQELVVEGKIPQDMLETKTLNDIENNDIAIQDELNNMTSQISKGTKMSPYEIQTLLYKDDLAIIFIKNFPRIVRELKNYKYVSPEIVIDVTRLINNEQKQKLDYNNNNSNDKLIIEIGKLLHVITQILPKIVDKIDPSQQQALLDMIQKYDAINQSYKNVSDKLVFLSTLLKSPDAQNLLNILKNSVQGVENFLMSDQEIIDYKTVSQDLSQLNQQVAQITPQKVNQAFNQAQNTPLTSTSLSRIQKVYSSTESKTNNNSNPPSMHGTPQNSRPQSPHGSIASTTQSIQITADDLNFLIELSHDPHYSRCSNSEKRQFINEFFTDNHYSDNEVLHVYDNYIDYIEKHESVGNNSKKLFDLLMIPKPKSFRGSNSSESIYKQAKQAIRKPVLDLYGGYQRNKQLEIEKQKENQQKHQQQQTFEQEEKMKRDAQISQLIDLFYDYSSLEQITISQFNDKIKELNFLTGSKLKSNESDYFELFKIQEEFPNGNKKSYAEVIIDICGQIQIAQQDHNAIAGVHDPIAENLVKFLETLDVGPGTKGFTIKSTKDRITNFNTLINNIIKHWNPDDPKKPTKIDPFMSDAEIQAIDNNTYRTINSKFCKLINSIIPNIKVVHFTPHEIQERNRLENEIINRIQLLNRITKVSKNDIYDFDTEDFTPSIKRFIIEATSILNINP